jgi:hypothetical protein
MAKNSVRDFDATAANNTDIQSVDIAENCAPSGINNAIRELMADIKDVSAGTIALESPSADSMTVTGDLTVDTTTLKVDSTNNRVGIGTASPSEVLEVNGNIKFGDGHFIGDGGGDNLEIVSSSGENIIYKAAGGIHAFYDSGSNERMRIDSSGNVGIGTTSPGHPLHVSGNGFGTIAKFSADDGANNPRLLIYGSSDGMHIQRTSGSGAANLMFEVGGGEGGGTEAMRIDSSGNVLVGTTGLPSSTNKGVALRPVSLDRTIIQMSSASVSTGVELIQFRNPNGQVGYIATNASSTTYATSSDYRLKENVTDITDGIARIKLLNPSRFNFIVDADTTVDGFLAHEAQEVVPEAVSGEKDAMMDEDYVATPATGEIYTPAQDATFDDDGNELTAATDEVVHSTDVEQPDTLEEGRQWRETTAAVMATRTVPSYQGIDQSKLVPLLTAALQEAVAEIEALKTRVAALEG